MIEDFTEALGTLGWDRVIDSLTTDDTDIALLCEIYKMAYRASDYQRTADPDGGLCWKIRSFCIEQITDLLERKEEKKMAKFCELAGKVTNCTDNCKFCLEEETKSRDIEIGDKVRYIAGNSIEDKELGCHPCYPPKGTIGVVVRIEDDSDTYLIKWPDGTTKGDGLWYADRESIKLV